MTTVDNSEILLAQEAARGDKQAFAALFQKYFQAVYNYALVLCTDPAEAEDLTQEAFIRAHKSLPNFGPPWNFRTWIFRMTRNLFLDGLRKRRAEVPLDDAVRDPFPGASPESRAMLEDVAGRVRDTLDRLPPRSREALVLREIHGLAYAEIAEVLATTQAYVKTLLARSRLQFQEAFGIQLLIDEPTEDCHEVTGLLQAYHDGETTLDVELFVKGHLKTCEACQKRRQWLITQSGLLAALVPVPPPPGLAGAILGRLGISASLQPPAGGAPGRPHFFRDHPWTIFFCAAALLGGLGWLFYPGSHPPLRATPSSVRSRSTLVLLPSVTPLPLQTANEPDVAGGTATLFLAPTPTSLLLVIVSATPTQVSSGPVFTRPELSTDHFYSGGAGCGPLDLIVQIGVTGPNQIASVVLFFHLEDQSGSGSTPWNAGAAMEPQGGGVYSYDLGSATIPAFNSFSDAWLVYQFAATGAGGQVLLRSPAFKDVTLSMCGKK